MKTLLALLLSSCWSTNSSPLVALEVAAGESPLAEEMPDGKVMVDMNGVDLEGEDKVKTLQNLATHFGVRDGPGKLIVLDQCTFNF